MKNETPSLEELKDAKSDFYDSLVSIFKALGYRYVMFGSSMSPIAWNQIPTSIPEETLLHKVKDKTDLALLDTDLNTQSRDKLAYIICVISQNYLEEYTSRFCFAYTMQRTNDKFWDDMGKWYLLSGTPLREGDSAWIQNPFQVPYHGAPLGDSALRARGSYISNSALTNISGNTVSERAYKRQFYVDVFREYLYTFELPVLIPMLFTKGERAAIEIFHDGDYRGQLDSNTQEALAARLATYMQRDVCEPAVDFGAPTGPLTASSARVGDYNE